MSKSFVWVVIAYLLSAGRLWAQLDRAPPPSAANPLSQDSARVAAGAVRFKQLCTGCHGRQGEGGQGEGQGPNLAMSWEVRRARDQELFNFIHNGVKGTAMPAFALPEEQVWELAAFVRSLNAPANTLPVPGDISSGQAIFFAEGQCSACHMIRGRGGYLGPDLSNIGAMRRLGELRDSLIRPALVPSADFQPLLIRGTDGKPTRAVAKHVSAWSAEVIDEHGELHLIHGEAAVHSLHFLKQSWMPADYAQRLSADQIQNLLAFLSRQAVQPPQSGARAKETRSE